MLPFDSLGDPRKFEQVCYDLVTELRFQNVRWRGPGADGGRDIEAEWFYTDPSGHFTREQWYIECKYYAGSVPYAEIEPKLLAADRDNKDCLLVITNSMLMNTCLDSIEKWIHTRSARLRFRYWNGHDLTKRLLDVGPLVQKYFSQVSLSGDDVLRQTLRSREATIAGVEQRLGSSLASLVQGVSGRLEFPQVRNNLALAKDELVLLSGLLQALRALGQPALSPSVRLVDVRDVLKLAASTSLRRLPFTCTFPNSSVPTRSSFPLLLSAAHELAGNASIYGASNASIKLATTGTEWKALFKNDGATEAEPDPWPRLGWRSANARRLYPSGSGQGCWIASHIADLLGHKIAWDRTKTGWTVELQGLLEVTP